jgi:hypothetical protein
VLRSKIKRIVLAAIFACGGLMPVAAGAGVTVTYETQGRELFSFSVPDDWQVLTGFEVPPAAMPGGESPMARIVSVSPVDSGLVMWTGLWAPPKVSRLADAPEYVRRVAPRLLAEVEVTFREEREINGLQARVVSGTGFRDGRDFDFALVAIQITRDRVALAAFIGEPEAHDRYERALIGIVNSITSRGDGG